MQCRMMMIPATRIPTAPNRGNPARHNKHWGQDWGANEGSAKGLKALARLCARTGSKDLAVAGGRPPSSAGSSPSLLLLKNRSPRPHTCSTRPRAFCLGSRPYRAIDWLDKGKIDRFTTDSESPHVLRQAAPATPRRPCSSATRLQHPCCKAHEASHGGVLAA